MKVSLFDACVTPKWEYDGRMGATHPGQASGPEPQALTGTGWAHQEQVEMLRLGTARIIDEHDPDGDLTMMP